MWSRMKRQHSGYILAVLMLSLCSHGVHIASVATESWVEGEAYPFGTSGNVSHINYGLFQGTWVRTQDNSSETFTLTITCLLYLDVCAFTCQDWDSLRRQEVSALYLTGEVLYDCPDSDFSTLTTNETLSLSQVRSNFITGAVWLATLVSTTLCWLLNLAALTLTAYNISHIPTNTWVSIRGLYFWFSASSVLVLLTLAIWASEFVFKLNKNIGTVETIAGSLDSSGGARLGYSFWAQFGVVALQICCMALLYYRETLFDRRPMLVRPLKIPSNIIGNSQIP